MKYRLHWKNNKTGETGRGEPVSMIDAKAWAKIMNAKYPRITHWIERC